jgi:hypothetical protein
MNRLKAAKIIFLVNLLLSPASGQIADSTENFLDEQIAGFLDSLVVTSIDSGYDIVMYIIIPFLGMYGIMLYLTRKSFQIAEDNFRDNSYGSSDLSDQAKKTTTLIAAAVSAVTVSMWGGFTPIIALLLGLIGAIFIIWQFWGAFQQTRWRSGNSTPTRTRSTTDTSDTSTTSTDPSSTGGNDGGDGGNSGGSQGSQGGEGGNSPPGGGRRPPVSPQFVPMMRQMMQAQGIGMNPAIMQFIRLLQGDVQRGPDGKIYIGGDRDHPISQEAFEELRQALHEQGGMIGENTMLDILEVLDERGDSGLTDELLREIIQIIESPDTEDQINIDINERIARIIVNQIQAALNSGQLQRRDCVVQFIHLMQDEIYPGPGNTVNLITQDSTPDQQLREETVSTFFQEINSLNEDQAEIVGQKIAEMLASGPEELNEDFLEQIVASLGDWLGEGNKNGGNRNNNMADDLADLEGRVLQQDMEDINQLHKLITSLIQEDKRVLQDLARMDAELEVADKLFGRAQQHFMSGSPDPMQGAVEVAEAEMIMHHFEQQFAEVKNLVENERESLSKVEDVEDEINNLQTKLDNAMTQLANDHGLPDRDTLVTQAIKNHDTDLNKKPSNFDENDIKRLVRQYASESTKERLKGWLS